MQAVLAGFSGIRSSENWDRDYKHIKIWHLILVGVFTAICFVMGLLLLVKTIVE